MGTQLIANHREGGLQSDHRFRLAQEEEPYGSQVSSHRSNVSYDNEVTAFVENHRMRRLTVVKSKEILIWIFISEIYVDDPNSGKTAFGTPTGWGKVEEDEIRRDEIWVWFFRKG
ncbi:hypothetical protein EZV62_011842 [Acer yangbiense]|uniref:Uncharacterized protein n=1 Tax=Acer yangbiense TaxID=1000413 RepID=A0A5C7I725_9ROSI|nr:hypothetical protein EZV62_011842 [Acer yangbiense]